jgi:two-component system NtrC family sensor kinase
MNSGKITIQTSYEDHRIYIRIIDTGIGIENQILNRVFEPFFTTRDVGEGAGLGLTVSRDIVRSHGGEISIESTPGTGTTVIIWLPVNKEL